MDDGYFIPDEIYYAIRHRKSNYLLASFKSMSYIKLALRMVEDRPEGKVSILMLAVIFDLEDVVKQLLSWDSSPAHFDLCGTVNSIDGDLIPNVTALWCAVDRGYYNLASMLMQAGATDLGGVTSPLTYFIKRGRLDRIQYLLDKNDQLSIIVDRNDLFDCFHLAVSSGHGDIVLYFLAYGVTKAVRMGQYNGQALEKAIINGHYNCVEILFGTAFSAALDHQNMKKYFELAIKHNRLEIIDYLLDFYRDESSIDTVELLASAYLIPRPDQLVLDETRRTVDVLKCALKKRALLCIPKKMRPLVAAYEFRQECQSVEELELISNDLEMFIQALLIRERLILPTEDRKLILGIACLGTHFMGNGEFDRYLLIRIHYFEVCHEMGIDIDLQSFVRLFCRMFASGIMIRTESLLEICQLVFHPSQSKWTSRRLAIAVCLVAIVAKVLEEEGRDMKERQSLLQWVDSLCQRQPISKDDGQTMLHLSVNEEIYRFIDSQTIEIESILFFPNKQVTWLLINRGRRWIDIDAKNRIRSETPLHVIAKSITGINAIEIIKLLLNAQAHIDCVNYTNETPAEVALRPEITCMLQSEQNPPRLKCLCARLIIDEQLECTTQLRSLSNALYRFVTSHDQQPQTDILFDDHDSTNDDSDFDFGLFD